MLTGLTVEDVHVYYTLARVHAVATSKNIRLFVEIPLKAADRYIELYQVHSLPFFHRGINKCVMIDEAFSYLAVAESRQFFTLMIHCTLCKHTQDLYTVCSSDMVLKIVGEQNCLIVFFLGMIDTVLKKCKRLILIESFEPIWLRSPEFNYWVYSLSTPTQVTVLCQEAGLPRNFTSSYQKTLHGTGVLPNSTSCYTRAQNFKLLTHSLGKATVNLIKTNIVLPNMENILNFSGEGLVQLDAIQHVDLQPLDEIMEQATTRSLTVGIDVNKFVTTLRGKGVYRQTTSCSWVIVIINIFIMFGILCFASFKFIHRLCSCIWKCALSPRSPHVITEEQELH
jgi:hypothetical protein